MSDTKRKIVVIVGPTASGKTFLSIALAKKYNGEVVSADSRQVYRGLDLGTGKVTLEEMQGVPHHLLDIADPREIYTVHDYVRDGRKAVHDIFSRGKLPILVGGTFFYIDALLGKISTPPVPPNKSLRVQLEERTLSELQQKLKNDFPSSVSQVDIQNKRRVIRALEILDALGAIPEKKEESLYETLTIGISLTKEVLTKNIHDRLHTRLSQGMVSEITKLHDEGLSFERMHELGLEYRSIAEYLEGNQSYEEACETIIQKSIQYAKRQMTWLKRDTNIVWIDPKNTEEIYSKITKFLG